MKAKLAALMEESYTALMYYNINSIWIRQGNRERISIETGLLPQASDSLPSFIMMIYSCSLHPDLIFLPHVRCGSLGKAFTINKQMLFTWLILQEAMRLKHLQPDIHLPHNSKYHRDAIDIYRPKEQTVGLDGCYPVRQWKRWMMKQMTFQRVVKKKPGKIQDKKSALVLDD